MLLRNNFYFCCLIGLLIFWFIISFVRTGINLVKIFNEELPWVSYSDGEKKYILYGDTYIISRYFTNHFSNAKNILIVSTDGKPYFLSRYLLYPQKIYWSELESNITNNNNKYQYIIIYHPTGIKEKYSGMYFDKFEKNRVRYQVENNHTTIAIIYKTK